MNTISVNKAFFQKKKFQNVFLIYIISVFVKFDYLVNDKL